MILESLSELCLNYDEMTCWLFDEEDYLYYFLNRKIFKNNLKDISSELFESIGPKLSLGDLFSELCPMTLAASQDAW